MSQKTRKASTDDIETPSNNNSETRKTCFVITPIGAEESSIRRAAQGVLDAVIKPVLGELNYTVTVAHEIPNPGSINNQVIEKILDADMVVANLTTLNPNVMYELAIRHAKRKPVVTIVDKGITPNLSFDLLAERTIFYTNDMQGVRDLGPSLKAAVIAAQDDENEPDNPIYRVVTMSVMKDVSVDNVQKELIDMFFDLRTSVEELVISQRAAPNAKNSASQLMGRTSRYIELEIEIDKTSNSNFTESVQSELEIYIANQIKTSMSGFTSPKKQTYKFMVEDRNAVAFLQGLDEIIVKHKLVVTFNPSS